MSAIETYKVNDIKQIVYILFSKIGPVAGLSLRSAVGCPCRRNFLNGDICWEVSPIAPDGIFFFKRWFFKLPFAPGCFWITFYLFGKGKKTRINIFKKSGISKNHSSSPAEEQVGRSSIINGSGEIVVQFAFVLHFLKSPSLFWHLILLLFLLLPL